MKLEPIIQSDVSQKDLNAPIPKELGLPSLEGGKC